MTRRYETLDDYLDDLDRIKERVAGETAGMNVRQVQAYFARARQELERITGGKVHLRKTSRRTRSAKR